MEIDRWRDRKMCLLLYPDDVTHVKAIDIIKESFNYAIILHDKDFDDNGELKKPHFHCVVKFGNARFNYGVAEELGISPNYIQKCNCLDSALLYLVHYNSPDKYQYDISEVSGSLSNHFLTLLNKDVSEADKIIQLISFIDSQEHYVSYRDILLICCENGLWSQFRKLGYGIKLLLDEHNQKYKNY